MATRWRVILSAVRPGQQQWLTGAEEDTDGQSGEDDWFGYGKARVSSAWCGCKRAKGSDQAAPAESGFGFLRESSKVSGGVGGDTRGANYWARVIGSFGHEVRLMARRSLSGHM